MAGKVFVFKPTKSWTWASSSSICILECDMPINPAGDKQRYYVSCWANDYPANDEEAAVDEGDQHEWHSTKATAETAMNRLFDSGTFTGVYVIDCGVDCYQVVDYRERREETK